MTCGFLLAMLLCLLAGYGLAGLLHLLTNGRAFPRIAPGSALELFVLGAGVFTWLESLLLYAGGTLRGWHLVVFAVLSVGGSVWCARRLLPFGPMAARAGGSRRGHWALVLPAVFLAGNAVFVLSSVHLDHDMVAHILLKGKVLAHEGLRTAPYLNDPVFANAQPHYPPFVPVIYGVFQLWGPGNSASYVVSQFLLIGGVAAALHGWLREHVAPLAAALWVLVFLSAPRFLDSVFLVSATEIPLAAALLCAGRSFHRWLDSDSAVDLGLAALYAGLATLMKNDALFFGVAMLAVAASRLRLGVWRPAAIWLAIVLPWALMSRTFPSPINGPEAVLTTAALSESLPNVPVALATVGRALLLTWNHVFPLAALVAIVLLVRRRGRSVVRLIGTLFLVIACYAVLIWLYVGHIASSPQTFVRLLCPLYALAVAALALGVEAALRRAGAARPKNSTTGPTTGESTSR